MSHPVIAALKAYRTKHGLTQTDVAQRSGISKTTLCELEAGQHSPKLTSAQAYANALGLHVDILGGDHDAQTLRAVLANHQPLVYGQPNCCCMWYPAADSGLTHADHVIGMWQLMLGRDLRVGETGAAR